MALLLSPNLVGQQSPCQARVDDPRSVARKKRGESVYRFRFSNNLINKRRQCAEWGRFSRHHLTIGVANAPRLRQIFPDVAAGSLMVRLRVIELALELASERSPVRLVERFCRGAQEVLSAQCAAVGMLDDDGEV